MGIKKLLQLLYRSPNSSENDFLKAFAETIEKIGELRSDIIIAGDVTTDWSKRNYYTNKFKWLWDDNGLKPVTKGSTRLKENSTTTIDYAYTTMILKIKITFSTLTCSMW